MYLYDRKNSKINVYEFKSDKEKIYNYKKEQMSTIPVEKKILMAMTDEEKSLENAYDSVNYSKLQCETKGFFGGYSFHKLTPYCMNACEKSRQEKILEEYFNIDTNHYGKLLEVTGYKGNTNLDYLLLLQCLYYQSTFSNGIYIMHDIINLPKSLYVFEKFASGQFNLTDESELKDIVKLYNLSNVIATFDINEIKKLDEYNITNNTMLQIENNLHKSEKILKLIKK